MSVANDLALYEDNAQRWWDEDDRFFRSLRSVGEFHLELMREAWGPRLAGARLVELGCGGGFVSLSLADLGAEVVGVDLSAGSLRAARGEAERRSSNGRFLRADLTRCPLDSGSFDLAVMADVLEHVEDPASALREASRLLRPGGGLFVSTFDRTWKSRVAVVWLAEGVGLVPRGTHDARLFVRPAELERAAEACGLSVDRIAWERPALLRTLRDRCIRLERGGRGPGFSAFLTKDLA